MRTPKAMAQTRISGAKNLQNRKTRQRVATKKNREIIFDSIYDIIKGFLS